MSSIRARAPKASSPLVRRVMQANVGRETSPERALCDVLGRLELCFEKHAFPEADLPIRADVVFFERKVCIFVDGCFWHGCPSHFKVPTTNAAWWEEKIRENVERDARQTRVLQERGWTVVRLWEHEILTASTLPAAVEKVTKALERGV